jgi:hypothetical protein
VDSDTRLDTFAELLMNGNNIRGDSRYEVIGAGLGVRRLGVRKSGSWWGATLHENATIQQFLDKKFWNPGTDSTYMEITYIKGGYPKG